MEAGDGGVVPLLPAARAFGSRGLLFFFFGAVSPDCVVACGADFIRRLISCCPSGALSRFAACDVA